MCHSVTKTGSPSQALFTLNLASLPSHLLSDALLILTTPQSAHFSSKGCAYPLHTTPTDFQFMTIAPVGPEQSSHVLHFLSIISPPPASLTRRSPPFSSRETSPTPKLDYLELVQVQGVTLH